ncbi:MAG: UbiA prenyltransferase family protein [Rhodothermales bacterium]|nr:UbiA prenyltransferase family protein [Rhodothermales bacterium]MBO6780157.1 UbiA prenyltransferase family protein [Rhodothermales bacterium]
MGAASRRTHDSGLTSALDASGLPIPLIAVALVAASAVLLGTEIPGSAYTLAAAGSFAIYLLDRAWPFSPEDAANRPERATWHGDHRWYRFPALILAIGLSLWALLQLPRAVWLFAAALTVLAGLHAVPLGGRRLKASAWLKPSLVAAAWAAGAVLIVPFATGGEITRAVVLLLAVRGLTVAANVVLTDLADSEGDAAAGLTSLATRSGERAVRSLASALIIAGAVLCLAQFVRSGNVLWSVEALGLVLYLAVVQRRAALPEPIVLDLLVAWPAVTWLVSRL